MTLRLTTKSIDSLFTRRICKIYFLRKVACYAPNHMVFYHMLRSHTNFSTCCRSEFACSTRVIQKVLPVGSYLCSGIWCAFKIFHINTCNLWLHCVKISFLYLSWFFLGAPHTSGRFGAPETVKVCKAK